MYPIITTQNAPQPAAFPFNLQQEMSNHYDQCMQFGSDFFDTDILQHAIDNYCNGYLAQDEMMTDLLFDTLSPVFVPWLCTRWPVNNHKTLSTLYAENFGLHCRARANLTMQLQATPFSFYQVKRRSSNGQLVLMHLLTKRSSIIQPSTEMGYDTCLLKPNDIIFAMIEERSSTVYAIAPITIEYEHYKELNDLHHLLRQTHHPRNELLQCYLYDEIMHITYVKLLLRSIKTASVMTQSNAWVFH